MNITPLQANLSAGELSPLMINRTDTEGHAAAVEIMENVIAQSQGPAKNRDPLIFINEFVDESTGRVEILQLSINLFLVAVFLDFEVQFFLSDGSPVIEGHTTNPRFSEFGAGWEVTVDNVASLVIFNRHLCILAPRNVPGAFAGIKQTVELTDTADLHEFVVHSDVETNSDELHLLVGTADGLGDLLDIVITTNQSSSSFPPSGNATIFIQVLNEAAGAAPSDNPVSLTVVDIINATASGQVDVTPYPAASLSLLQFIEAPEGDTVYIVHPAFPQHFIVWDDILGSVTFNPVDFGETAPPEWIDNNFPATGVVHRGRIYYAGTPNEPEQIWASVIGDFTDMTTGVNADDGFSVVNAHFGAIVWMLSTKDLIFGSANAEYIVTSLGPVIFIGDIQIDRQSTYGSINVQAEQVGDKVLYITRDARRLHAMQFDRDTQAWLSDEISFPSEHIMKPATRQMARERYPHDLIWMNLINGDLAACNYNRPMNIYGWHQHNTQGFVVDITTGDIGSNSVLVALVLRESGNLTLEVSNPTGGVMDSRVTRVPVGFVVDDLGHLEGETVQVIADNAVHPDRVVVGGEITLQLEAELAQVGLGFRKRIKTLPLDKGSNKGSARAYVKKYKDIYIGLLDSAVPFINGQQPPIRTPQVPMGLAPPLQTGLVRVHNLGFDREATVDIVQDGPLPLHVTGIYGEVVQEKL